MSRSASALQHLRGKYCTILHTKHEKKPIKCNILWQIQLPNNSLYNTTCTAETIRRPRENDWQLLWLMSFFVEKQEVWWNNFNLPWVTLRFGPLDKTNFVTVWFWALGNCNYYFQNSSLINWRISWLMEVIIRRHIQNANVWVMISW